jgi:hypothetical protein
MKCNPIWEDAAATKHVNDYYPDIVRYHENELLSFFDALNTDYVIERKSMFNGIRTKQQALEYINEVRASFAECLGELPGGGPARAEVLKTIDMGRYTIDNILIEALPGYFLNASFYYPAVLDRPAPSILFLCGHSPEGKANRLYASFCVEAVLNGFCVLTFDPVGQGERRMYDKRDAEYFTGSPDAVHYLLGQQAWLAGTSITAYMMLDNVKALDYLCSRKEVNIGAVAVAGNSGGGHMAAFMGAYDTRLAAVVSSCYITELSIMIHHIGAQECEQSLSGFMERGLDLADLVIAAAPKPYFIGASLMDFFPIDGTRDAYLDAKKIYSLLECRDNLEIYVAPKPHGFWRETREHALRFLCGHFGVPFAQDKEIDYGKLPAEAELNCLKSGDINTCNTVLLHQMIHRKARASALCLPVVHDTADFDSFSRQATAGLLDLFGIDMNALRPDIREASCRYDDAAKLFVSNYAFISEKYMTIHATLYERERGPKRAAALHVGGLSAGDTVLDVLLGEYAAVLCVEPRGAGRGAVDPGCYFYEPEYFENAEASLCCTAVLHGHSIGGMRVMDTLSAVKLLTGRAEYAGCRIALSGEGESALTALYAAVALGGRDVRLKNLLCSLASLVGNRVYLWGPSVFIYGMLRLTDVPALLCALAGNSVCVDGFLDHMKRPVRAGALGALPETLRELSKITGGCTDLPLTV